MPKPPEFIRNTWGSSAGAGSGDFHVYRGVRRREYARQKFLDEKEAKTTKDDEYQRKLVENANAAEERTAKKRAKRLKKKKSKQKKKSQHVESESESEHSDDETEAACSDAKKICEETNEELQAQKDTHTNLEKTPVEIKPS
ncbi:PRKR-interacting protein 1 homolog isoform X2 [Watersipora subatra]